MTKTEFLGYLIPELKRLEEADHVTELLNTKSYKAADEVAAKVEHKFLKEFYHSKEFEEIADKDIPMQYKIAWGVYLRKSGYDEIDIMGDEHYNWINSLYYTNTLVGVQMAKVITYYNINVHDTFEKFMGLVK